MMLRACLGFGATMALVAALGCGGPECTVATTQYTTTFTALGNIGATVGKPVARFDLTQDFVSHTPYAACKEGPLEDVGAIRATVTNVSSTPLVLQFDLQGINARGIMVWDHVARVERLAPNETADLGTVGISPIHVDLGANAVFTEITVVP
jgi:hypothetical protein